MEESKETAGRIGSVDMLHGSLADKLLRFAAPIAASSMLQQLFNSADVAVAGRFAAEGALAAVGSNAVLVGLFVNLFTGLSVGVNVIISQHIGQQKTKDVTTVVHTAMLFAMLCGVAVMAVGLLISKPVLTWMNTPPDVLERAVLYLRIYCLGMPLIIPYNFGAAILRSIGDTKRPMYCLIASGVLNVCLNLLLVIGFRLDVAGVAIATVTANLFSAGAVLFILCREEEMLRLHLDRLRISRFILRWTLRIGAPAALQSAVFSLSNICLQTAVNRFGSSAVAGMAAAVNFEYFAFFIISAFNQAATTFVGQNYGAGQYERCRRVLRLCMGEGAGFAVLLSALFVLGRDVLIRIYTVDPVEIEYAMTRLLIALPALFIASSYEITGSALRGMGRSLAPALLTVFGSVVFRVIWVYAVFPHWNSFPALIVVYPISWLLTGSLVVGYYFLVRKRIFSEQREDTPTA